MATRKSTTKVASNDATTNEPIVNTTKPVAKPKEIKAPMFTRIQAVGIVMKANPDASKEVICNKADTLFIKMTGSASNSAETNTQYSKALNFLKGYNA